MWILLCGTFDEVEMLKHVEKLDAPEANKPPETFERPFNNMTNIPDIVNTRHESLLIKAPADEEDECQVSIGFLGRHAQVRFSTRQTFV